MKRAGRSYPVTLVDLIGGEKSGGSDSGFRIKAIPLFDAWLAARMMGWRALRRLCSSLH